MEKKAVSYLCGIGVGFGLSALSLLFFPEMILGNIIMMLVFAIISLSISLFEISKWKKNN